MPLLKLENVSKSFEGIKALVNVNLVVEEGEILSIIGPNGAGKTTLFNVISGVRKPDSGRVIFRGVDITNYPPHKRALMGMSRAFQIPRLFYNMTVLENVIVGGMFIRGKVTVEEIRQEAERVLKLVGLHHKKDSLALNLTSPERKLLELARALAGKPRLLLLDEIVAGIPPSDIDRIMSLVRSIALEEGISVVALVEHVMRAVKYTEKVYFLHQGQIMLSGSPEEVLNNEFVKRVYLGE